MFSMFIFMRSRLLQTAPCLTMGRRSCRKRMVHGKGSCSSDHEEGRDRQHQQVKFESLSFNPIVPANPEPPNHPSIFCAPSAKKTTPKTSLKITVAMLSSVETIVWIMFFLPACLASRLLCPVTRAATTVGALSSDKA